MTVQRSERAVRALADADPEFGELCKMLYGDVVDPWAIWQDVYGVAKADKSRAERIAEGGGLAATAIGTGYGVRELAEKLPQAAPRTAPTIHRAMGAAGKVKGLVPTGVRRVLGNPKVAAGTAAAMLAGDAAATATLERGRRQQVDKILAPGAAAHAVQTAPRLTLPSMGKLKTGTLQSMRRLVPTRAPSTPTPSPAAKPVSLQAQGRAAQIGNVLGRAPAVPAAAGGAAVGGGAMGVRNRRAQAPTMDYYGKSDSGDGSVVWAGDFSKFDDDKQLAFGWASIVEKDGLPVVDRQGDLIDPDEIEKAAYDYVLKSRVGGDMHRRTADDRAHHVSDLVESFVVTREKVEKMGLPSNTPLGWWVGYKINDPETWDLVKKGGRTGFSIHGRGKRVEKSLDEAMGA